MSKSIQSPPLKESWIQRKKYEFRKEDLGFFPPDSLGARSKDELAHYPERGKAITLVYSFTEWSGDIAARKNGVARPRDHDSMKELVSRARVGDIVRLTELGLRRYKVELLSSGDGSVIV